MVMRDGANSDDEAGRGWDELYLETPYNTNSVTLLVVDMYGTERPGFKYVEIYVDARM